MAILTSYEVGGDAESGIGDVGGNEYAHAQSFQLPVESNVTGAELRLRGDGNDPTDDVTVRVELDNGGLPSGTLVHANATSTIAAGAIGTAYDWEAVVFDSFLLPASTSYHLTATVPDQLTGKRWLWYRDSGDGGYASGEATRETNAVWAILNGGLDDMLFRVTGDEIVSTTAFMTTRSKRW